MENPANPVDVADMAKFKSRFKELATRFNTSLKFEGMQGTFKVHTFLIKPQDVDALATALTEKPGELGWGSMHDLISKLTVKS